MTNKLLTGFTFFFLAIASHAETVIEIRTPSDPAFEQVKARKLGPETRSATRLDAKTEVPSRFYILPHYLVETTDPGGETTLVAIRNEDSVEREAAIVLFPDDSTSPLVSPSRNLLPKEVWTVNLRDVLTDEPSDVDGFIRGWGRIVADGPITVDYFQATPSDSFAAGELAVDIDGGEFCELNKVRFLLGGAFSGGTILTLMVDLPLGDDPAFDPPSVTGSAYNEAGTLVNTFRIFTDKFSERMNVSSLVVGGTNFGSLDIRFENVDSGFSGGASTVTHDASGVFSVGVKGFCLDASSPGRQRAP